MIGCSRVSASLGELIIMNLEYSSTGLNLNQWKILLDLENACYFLVDNLEDLEIICWLKCQDEWRVIAQFRNVTIFQRKAIGLVIPVV